jgi:hypothetical protein
MLSRLATCLALLLAVQASVARGESTVLCVEDSGMQRIELASSACCVGAPLEGRERIRWSAEDPCGPCNDYPIAGAAMISDASGGRHLGACLSLAMARRTGLETSPLREFALHLARPGERMTSLRTSSPLRV